MRKAGETSLLHYTALWRSVHQHPVQDKPENSDFSDYENDGTCMSQKGVGRLSRCSGIGRLCSLRMPGNAHSTCYASSMVPACMYYNAGNYEIIIVLKPTADTQL